MIKVSDLRHQKEKSYYSLSLVIGIIIWALIIIGTLGTGLIYVLIGFISLWVSQQVFKVQIYSRAIRINSRQYPELNEMIKEVCEALSIERPEVFVINGAGIVNAFAIKFLSGKYVVLYSDLVDLMLERNEENELKMIVAHEMAHHAAGHVSIKRNFLLYPARIIPFLGKAYSRACELTADRVGAILTNDNEASKRSLLSIICGSKALSSQISIEEFRTQEKDLPVFFTWLHEVFSTHPRMSIRVRELDKYLLDNMTKAVEREEDSLAYDITVE